MDSNRTKIDVTPVEYGRKRCYSINEVVQMFGVNAWTIRMWSNRFDILKPGRDPNGDLLFTSADMERIGTICHLSKVKGMTLKRVKKYLESTS